MLIGGGKACNLYEPELPFQDLKDLSLSQTELLTTGLKQHAGLHFPVRQPAHTFLPYDHRLQGWNGASPPKKTGPQGSPVFENPILSVIQFRQSYFRGRHLLESGLVPGGAYNRRELCCVPNHDCFATANDHPSLGPLGKDPADGKDCRTGKLS